MQVEFTENLEFALVRVLYKRNDSAFHNGCLHNHCNVAPVRAPRSLTFEASNWEYDQRQNMTHSVSHVSFVVLPPQG